LKAKTYIVTSFEIAFNEVVYSSFDVYSVTADWFILVYVILLSINVDCFIVHHLVIASVVIIRCCDAETNMKLLHANLFTFIVIIYDIFHFHLIHFLTKG
jgi:hypothetical protein